MLIRGELGLLPFVSVLHCLPHIPCSCLLPISLGIISTVFSLLSLLPANSQLQFEYQVQFEDVSEAYSDRVEKRELGCSGHSVGC